ncbi:MAG: ABC transporter substrate-binding protein [Chloroflexota bacterium]
MAAVNTSGRSSRRSLVASAAPAAGAALLLAACGPQGAGSGSDATQSKQPITLRVNHRTEKYIPERGKQFTQQYPHITVELLPDSGYEKLIAMLAAGDLGDIAWASTGVGSYFELAAQGHFLQLDSIVARDKYDLKQHFPRAIDTAKMVDNKLFGMPNLIHPSHIGLFYNVSLLETAGVKPPTLTSTYDDLVDIARQVMAAKPGAWGILTETSYPPLLCYIRSYGGEMLAPAFLGKNPAIDKGPAKQALQWLYDLRHRHKVHPLPTDKVDFLNGEVAMRTTGMWGGADAAKAADRFKMDAVLIPKGPSGKRGSQGHVDMWGVYAKTKHQDAAWLLLKHFASKDQGVAMMPETNIPGARPDSWAEFAGRPLFKVFADFMNQEGGPGPLALPWNYKMLDFQSVTQKALEPLWAGQQSVDATVAAAMGPMQQQLDLPRASGK